MEGYDPMGTHYVPNNMALNQAAVSTEEYINVMAPMGLSDQSNPYHTPNPYAR